MTTKYTGPAPRPNAIHKQALSLLYRQRRLHRALVSLPLGCDTAVIGRCHVDQIGAELVVVSVPSHDLVAPTLLTYQAPPANWRHSTLVVCAGAAPRRPLAVDELGLPDDITAGVTSGSSLRSITDFLTAPTPAARLIVTTHDHVRTVAAALQQAQVKADLLVCDQAQTLTGQPRARFRALLESTGLPTRHRLFLSSTPIEATAWLADADPHADAPLTLGDPDTFGPRVYSATHPKAIKHGVLVPTDVHVLRDHTDNRTHAASTGIVEAVRATADASPTAILTLHSRDDDAERLATALDGMALPRNRTIRARTLAPGQPATHRAIVNDDLSVPNPDVVTVVAVGPTLTEAIDLPGFDAVILADPHLAPAQIATAIGAATKATHGRPGCRVVLPIGLPTSGHDVDAALVSSPWQEPWLVLRALAEDSLDNAVHRIRSTAHARSYLTPSTPPRHQIRVAPRPNARVWTLTPITADAASRTELMQALTTWTTRHGNARPNCRDSLGKHRIGTWLLRVRHLFRDGLLLPHEVATFEALPGWAWTPADTAWWCAAAAWTSFFGTAKNPGDDAALWAALATTPGHDYNQRALQSFATLADFVSSTCARRRAGTLPPHIERAAEQLPYWRWDFIADDDHRMLVALDDYVADHNDFNVPHEYHDDDDLPLGAWLTAILRRRVTGRLAPPLLYELALRQTRHPQATPLDWNEAGTYWRLTYIALDKYTAREGSCRVPAGHVEVLPDFRVDLSHWSALQQHHHRAGTLELDFALALERLRGWVWFDTASSAEHHDMRVSFTPGSCLCPACERGAPPETPGTPFTTLADLPAEGCKAS